MSTETSILDLILRIRKAGTGTKETQDDLDKLKAKTEQSNSSFKNMTKGLADVKAGFDMVGQVLGYAQQAFDATVMKAANWGDEMGDLAQLTGTSVKDTSQLAATMELLGIKSDSLTKVIKSMTAQGLQPTMENIRKLAAEYQAIQDPVQKNEWLFKRFGKQAGDMAEVLGKSTDELSRFSAAASASGKVIDEEAAAAAERFNQSLAIMQQKAEGVAIAIGTKVIDAWDKLTAAQAENNAKATDAQLIYQSMAGGVDVTRAKVVDLVHDTDRLTTSTASVIVPISELTAANKDAADSHDLVAAAAGRAALAHDNDARAAAALKLGMGELTKEMIFNAASEGLSNEAKLQLAMSMGMVDQAAVGVSGKIQDLKTKYDTNRDGVIDLKEATSGYLEELAKIKGTVDAIPDYQVKVVNFAVTGNINGDDVQQLVTSDANNNRNVRRASGGPFSVGGSLAFNESPATRPEVIVANPQGGGYVLTKQDAQAAVAQTTNMGGITINVSGAGDPQAVAREVSRILAAQVRGLGSAGASVLGR